MKSRLAALSLFCIKVYAEHGEHAGGFLYFGGGLSVFKIGEIGDADVREPGEFGLSEPWRRRSSRMIRPISCVFST